MTIKVLVAPTEDFIKRSRTQLSLDVSAGASAVLTVPNSDGFAIDDYICVGVEGSERAELAQISAKSATSLTVTTLALAHKADEPVTMYRYNKRKFYGCTTATGSFVELTADGSPKTIQVTDPQGTLLEYTGGEGYTYFKATYYNSTTTDETATTDATAILADEAVRYCSLFAIKKQAGLLKNPYITDDVVEQYRVRAESEVKSYIMNRYELPLTEIPGIIENCATLLAAGYADYQEFGSEGEGVKWLNEARSILKQVSKGTMHLLDSDDAELSTKANATRVQGYPESVDNESGPVRFFTTNQRF